MELETPDERSAASSLTTPDHPFPHYTRHTPAPSSYARVEAQSLVTGSEPDTVYGHGAEISHRWCIELFGALGLPQMRFSDSQTTMKPSHEARDRVEAEARRARDSHSRPSSKAQSTRMDLRIRVPTLSVAMTLLCMSMEARCQVICSLLPSCRTPAEGLLPVRGLRGPRGLLFAPRDAAECLCDNGAGCPISRRCDRLPGAVGTVGVLRGEALAALSC